MEAPYEKRGLLFTNGYKSEDKHPDWTGKCTIDGTEYSVAGWNKYRDGKPPFISLAFTPKDDVEIEIINDQPTEELPGGESNIEDDDLPF